MRMKYIAMLSGGQDSTAMTLRLLELGQPVDYIVFSDTTLEFDEMYEYIDKLDAFFQRKYGIAITRLKPKSSYESWVFGEISERGERAGQIRGISPIIDMCYWRREAKEYPLNRWIKEQGITEYKNYIGYTFQEVERWKNKEQYNQIHPLVEWKWNEPDVQKYLKENMMENKLYQDFNRTGCGICQKQNIEAKYQLYKKYPKQWDYMVDIETRLFNERTTRGEGIRPSFHTTMFTWDMEKLFKQKDKQGTFEFEFEEVQDCFCKI